MPATGDGVVRVAVRSRCQRPDVVRTGPGAADCVTHRRRLFPSVSLHADENRSGVERQAASRDAGRDCIPPVDRPPQEARGPTDPRAQSQDFEKSTVSLDPNQAWHFIAWAEHNIPGHTRDWLSVRAMRQGHRFVYRSAWVCSPSTAGNAMEAGRAGVAARRRAAGSLADPRAHYDQIRSAVSHLAPVKAGIRSRCAQRRAASGTTRRPRTASRTW